MSVCSGARRVDLQDRLNARRQHHLVELLRGRALGEKVKKSGVSEEPEKFLNLGREENLESKGHLLNKVGHIEIKFQRRIEESLSLERQLF